MPKAKSVSAKAKPYQPKFTVSNSERLTEVRKSGDRMVRRATIMIRVDNAQFAGTSVDSDQGPVGNLMLVKYKFPELARPNAADFSSLSAPKEILIPKIKGMEFLAYGLNTIHCAGGNLDHWNFEASVGSCVFATTRDPEFWYDDWKAALDPTIYDFGEPSCALELLMYYAQPFAMRVDKPQAYILQNVSAALEDRKFGMCPNIDDGKMFQSKFPQTLQFNEVFIGIMAPGMFDKYGGRGNRRCDNSLWVNIDYDYEKIDMKQYFWLQTQEKDSIFNAYNDTPEAKVYAPETFLYDDTDATGDAAVMGYVSEGSLTAINMTLADNTPPNVAAPASSEPKEIAGKPHEHSKIIPPLGRTKTTEKKKTNEEYTLNTTGKQQQIFYDDKSGQQDVVLTTPKGIMQHVAINLKQASETITEEGGVEQIVVRRYADKVTGQMLNA